MPDKLTVKQQAGRAAFNGENRIMSKCKWDKCENEARAKSPFCSGTCKKREQRASGTDVPVVASGTESGSQDAPQSTNSGQVVAEHPHTLSEKGEEILVRAMQQVDSIKPSIRAMSDLDLQLRLKSYQGASWVNSPEHIEVLRRRGLEPYRATVLGAQA